MRDLRVIGKSKNPRCFKDLNRENLPVHYYNSPNAWMTHGIFWDWFLDHFSKEVIEHYGEYTMVHVLLDNCINTTYGPGSHYGFKSQG